MVYLKKRYFYNGVIDIDNPDQNETIKLLEVHDELNFNQGKKEWIHQNLMNFNEIPYQFPQLFLKIDYLKLIERSMLISILENEYLAQGEYLIPHMFIHKLQVFYSYFF